MPYTETYLESVSTAGSYYPKKEEIVPETGVGIEAGLRKLRDNPDKWEGIFYQ